MTCTWTPDPVVLGEDWETQDADVSERALLLATSSLLSLTNYRVGTCPITVRPCPEPRPCTRHDWEPYRFDGGRHDGMWLNACGCSTARWCAPASVVDLDGPVGYVSDIIIDGVEQDLGTGHWRIDNGYQLVWQGPGASPLPNTQDLNLPDTSVGTWSITYSKSYPIGKDGEMAVAELAREFAKALKPKGRCSLPRGVTNVARNGVTFTIQAALFPNGLTGLDLADQFILKWSPPGAPQSNARVFSPRSMTSGPRRTGALPVSGNLGGN